MASNRRAFLATVTPDTVERLEGNKGPYSRMRNAVVNPTGRDGFSRTVMMFGPQERQIGHLLQEGVPIDLLLRHTGGTMRVVGLPKGNRTDVETVIKTLYGVLSAHGIDDREAASDVISQMMGGEPDRIVGDDDLDPDVVESVGHILLPLLDAGIDHDDALVLASRIALMPIGRHLEEIALMRRQNVAREFLTRAA